MDPFHVVALVGTKLDETRRRLQTEIHGRRGRSGDDLYGIRKTIRTRVGLLTDKTYLTEEGTSVATSVLAVDNTRLSRRLPAGPPKSHRRQRHYPGSFWP
ncbi:transposase [Brevibacterium marinum]|uniref:Transposase n=1 Tax=Brevibacterium marinum TaxID=418643 RepID=A0A846RX81_9MICO|nr:transposase [Brevibacterium marinum]